MDANTVQKQRQQAMENEVMVDTLITFFHRNIIRGLLSPGKRSATDVYRLLQAVKDSPSKVDDFLKVLDGTHEVRSLDHVIDLATGICRFVVDFEKSLEEMIAAGKYDWRNSNITSAQFSITGTGTVSVDAKLFHFNRAMTSDMVEREFEAAGYRAATIAELLAFGAAFPEVQRRFLVAALGSVAKIYGDRRAPFLSSDVAGRHLSLTWRGDNWWSVSRFLAVRKVV